MSRRRTEKGEENGPQGTEAAEASTKTLLEMFMEQQRAQQEQQREQQKILLALVEQQKEELAQHRKEMAELRAQSEAHEERRTAVRLPKPTLQKLGPDDDIEHFLATFERIAKQQGWPEEVWATQLAGLLTGKAMAAYASLNTESAVSYKDVKKAVLHRYDVNEEAHRRRFRSDRKKPEESYKNWGDRLHDHFTRWTKEQRMPIEELMVLDQFLAGVPEDLRVWLKERKPESLQRAMELADDYTLARGTGRSAIRKSQVADPPAASSPGGRTDTSKPPFQPRAPVMEGRTQTNSKGERRCFQCGKYGHLMFNCPSRNAPTTSGASKTLYAKGCDEVAWNERSRKYLRRGNLDGRSVQMLVDSGCSQTMVSARLVDAAKISSQEKVPILCAHGDTVLYPTAVVKLQTGPWKREGRVVVASNLPVDVLLGTDLYEAPVFREGQVEQGLAVLTRAQRRGREQERREEQRREDKELRGKEDNDETETEASLVQGKSSSVETLDGGQVEGQPECESVEQRALECQPGKSDEEDGVTEKGEVVTQDGGANAEVSVKNGDVLDADPGVMRQWQQLDLSLAKARELAEGSQAEESGGRVHFFYQDGLLYRRWRPEDSDAGDVRSCEQLVLPRKCRSIVLRLAHDVPMAGHLGVTKTKDRVLQRYYWPGVFKDIADYCRTCEVCQRSQPRRPARAEMVPMPLITKPFQRIAMDLVGPLPRTQRGNRFILTICDYATRYPEAIALPSTEAPRISKELVAVFARVGIPDEILSDQGTNFMSTLLEEVYRLLQVKRIRTSPYHPQTDGLVERFNGTLKMMLRKFVSRNQKDWDDYLPYLLFAYREVPQESTGFSPFELLYGRRVRGPLDVLRESWTGCAAEETTAIAHVVEMRNRLEEMSELVKTNLEKAQQKQKAVYDRGAKPRSFEVGDEVLVLLPMQQNRLKLEWVGPYLVTRRVSPVDYEVEVSGRRFGKKVYHINLLKRWYPAQPDPRTVCLALDTSWQEGMSDEDIPVRGMLEENLYPLDAETVEIDMSVIASTLSVVEQRQLCELLQEFSPVIQTTPGRTTMAEHEIYVGDTPPIRQRPYRIPYSRRDIVREEVEKMLADRVIRPSTSPWASPIVLVQKKDGGVRFCVDFRKLNQVAKFDAYPMPRMEEMFESIGSATVVSTLDLASGYWQIPLAPGSREKTAFATPFGLFEFEVMPFGLHNAPATFQRMMDHVLRDCQDFARAYIDDIAVFSHSWEEHLSHLQQVFNRLQLAGLTVKLKKCRFGGQEVSYLGHVIGGGRLQPDPTKIQAVRDYPRPVTKRDVRAFLGLVGYYRRFIPHFATVAAPLILSYRPLLVDVVGVGVTGLSMGLATC